MSKQEKRVWWGTYFATLTGLHAYADNGHFFTVEEADERAAAAADLALVRCREMIEPDPAHKEHPVVGDRYHTESDVIRLSLFDGTHWHAVCEEHGAVSLWTERALLCLERIKM